MGPAEQKLPGPCVGRTATSSGNAASSRSEANCARVSSSVASAPSRSVRPALPTSRLPPVSTADGPFVPSPPHLPGQVLPRVSRRRAGDQPEATDLDGVALVRATMLEGISTAGRRHDLGAPGGSQLERARQVVVVDVRLDHVGEPPAPGVGDGRDPPRVAGRIDDDRLAVRGEQVGRVAQAGGEDDLEIHGAIRHGRPPRTGLAPPSSGADPRGAGHDRGEPQREQAHDDPHRGPEEEWAGPDPDHRSDVGGDPDAGQRDEDQHGGGHRAQVGDGAAGWERAVEQPGRPQARENDEADDEPGHGPRDEPDRRAAPVAAVRHRALARRSAIARARTVSHVAPSSTGRIARLRVSLTTVATSPAAGEKAYPVATTCAVSLTASPAHVPKTASDSPSAAPRIGSNKTPDQPEDRDRRHRIGRLAMRRADDRGEREDRGVAADRHPDRDQRGQRRPYAEAARQHRPEQQPDRRRRPRSPRCWRRRSRAAAQRQSSPEQHDPDPQGEPRRRPPLRGAGRPGRTPRCRRPARARAPRPSPVPAATQVPTSRAAAATTTQASRPGSAARSQARRSRWGQSRTRGGLSRSNMWTVSTKRTCLVW